VIVKSKVPFLVVQDKPSEKHRFTDIVFPIDFKAETREKLYWAIYLGKYFNSRIHIFKPAATDKSIAKKVDTNMNFAVRYLLQNNIDYQVHVAKGNGNFAKETFLRTGDKGRSYTNNDHQGDQYDRLCAGRT
jgi:hypothetical protein